MPKYNKNEIPYITIISLFFIIFIFTKVNSLSYSCKSNLNNCNKCNPITNLCEICNYPDIYVPDESGGCKGALKCISGKNYCNQCDQNGKLCQVCDGGYIPDENGGCTYSYNCKISNKGECIECKNNYFKYGKKEDFKYVNLIHQKILFIVRILIMKQDFATSVKQDIF